MVGLVGGYRNALKFKPVSLCWYLLITNFDLISLKNF
jgi:hypothetical protein